ncbi:MAG: tetratricopeptide repeat protein [Devosia sp.]
MTRLCAALLFLAVFGLSAPVAFAQQNFPGPALQLGLGQFKSLRLSANTDAQPFCSDTIDEATGKAGLKLLQLGAARPDSVLCRWYRPAGQDWAPVGQLIAMADVIADFWFTAPGPGLEPVLTSVEAEGRPQDFAAALRAMSGVFGEPAQAVDASHDEAGALTDGASASWTLDNFSASLEENRNSTGVMRLVYSGAAQGGAIQTGDGEPFAERIAQLLSDADDATAALSDEADDAKRIEAFDHIVSLYRQGMALGSQEAELNLARLYSVSPGYEADALILWKELADAGNGQGLYGYAMALYTTGSKYSIALSVPWLERAADAGNTDAMLKLADLYSTGNEIDANQELAENWLRRAAQAGDIESMAKLGARYYDRQNYAEALAMLLPASKAGNSLANLMLGYIYDFGLGVPRDAVKAARAYEGTEEPAAAWYLALIYDRDEDVRDPVASALNFEKALAIGNNDARDALAGSLADWSEEMKKALQRDALAKGYYTGEIDGQIGPGSRAAIAKFGEAPAEAEAEAPAQ